MTNRTLVRAAALATAVLLGTAACGSDDKGDKGSGGSGGGDSKPLTIGTLLPETGSLAFLGPPEIAGVKLALQDIKDAGGVNGKEVKLVEGDSGDASTDTATQTVNRELGSSVNAIIGAASSSVSLKVIDKVTGAGVILFSPANTSKKFTDYDDKDLYFRTAPPDNLQAQALAQIISKDGVQKLGILVFDDPYGTGLVADLEKEASNAGIQVVKKIVYDPKQTSFRTEVAQMKAANPDGVAVIGFDESAAVIQTMDEQGIGPQQGKKVYGSDGNMGNALGEKIKTPGGLNGMKGTTPLTKLSTDFQNRIKTVDPKLVDFNYSGESYDAVILVALAAQKAKSNKGADIAKEINGITKDGEKCTTYKDCLALIKDGKDVDYDGVTGKLDFTDAGEPGVGSYGVLIFGPDNKIKPDNEYVIVGG